MLHHVYPINKESSGHISPSEHAELVRTARAATLHLDECEEVLIRPAGLA